MLIARHDPIDPAGTIVYCMGATYPYEKRPVHIGEKFSKADCEQFFFEDVPKYIEPIRKCIPGFDAMPDHRRVAIVSAAYNLGPARVCKAMAPHFARGDIAGACGSLMGYVNSNGEYRRGLARRRTQEREWCLRND